MRAIAFALLCVLPVLTWNAALADPWKDESGKGWRGDYKRHSDEVDRRYRVAKIPRGLPPRGECRV